jgi:hypothetical protein
LCGVRSSARLEAGERLSWERWSPLLLAVPGLSDWSASERRAAAAIAFAKGGRRESDYAALLDRHPKLRRALLRMATPRE